MTKNKHKTISLHTFYGRVFESNNVFRIGDGLNLFYGFDRKMKKYGIDINTSDLKTVSKPLLHVYCDAPYPWEISEWVKLIFRKSESILICFESPLINPFSQFRIMKVFFRKIYNWNDDLVDNKSVEKFYLPQFSVRPRKKVKFKGKKFLVMISNKKSTRPMLRILSRLKIDLYKERLKAISFFENRPEIFDLYGSGWGNLKSYRGVVHYSQKNNLLSKYKYSLCFENAVAEGYISEKIFDCFKAGCVPVYFGASNVEKFINRNCFVDFRDFGSYQELLDYLESISEKKYSEYIKNIGTFLKSKEYSSKWSMENLVNIFVDNVQ